MLKFSQRVGKCLDAPVSTEAFNDLSVFLADLYVLDENASKSTHYDRLDEWLEPVYKGVRNKLEKYGFVNGSKEQNPDAAFWWLIYSVMSNVCHSIHLKSKVEHHHSSAWERSQALIQDINDIISFKHADTIG